MKLTEMAENLSTIADSMPPYNSSTSADTFYDRLLQTRASVEHLSLVNRFSVF